MKPTISRFGRFTWILAVCLTLMLPLLTASLAHGHVSGHSITAPLGDIATADGHITSSEWKDAEKIRIGTDEWHGYVYVKHDDTYLYVLLDHVSDTVKNPMGWDNGWVAIDTEKDGGMQPDDDDVLFHASGHWLLIGDTPYQYNGSQWAGLMAMGEDVNMTMQMEHMLEHCDGWAAGGQGALTTSPKSKKPHAAFEFRIPLAILEGRDQCGFYIVMQDQDEPKILDWPEVSNATHGTTPDFWPAPAAGEPAAGNFTVPMHWGVLTLGTERLPVEPDYTIYYIAAGASVGVAVIVAVGVLLWRRRRT